MQSIFGEAIEGTFGAGPTLETSVRFLAANGAVVTVTMANPASALGREEVLALARDAVRQVGNAQSIHAPEIRHGRSGDVECGAAFWSWATPIA